MEFLRIDNIADGFELWEYCCNCYWVQYNSSGGPFRCSQCGKINDPPKSFFYNSVSEFVDLIKMGSTLDIENTRRYSSGISGMDLKSISVVIFLCALREILLDHLLINLSVIKKDNNTVNRIMRGNYGYRRKQTSLLEELIGEKWENLIESVQNGIDRYDFNKMNTDLKNLNKVRNEILHDGITWNLEDDWIQKGQSIIEPLLNFYILVNNQFVHKIQLNILSVVS